MRWSQWDEYWVRRNGMGKSERDRAHQSCRKIETGRGSHIDMAKIETGWAKWMRGGASLKQDKANRNGLGPFEMVCDM